MLPAAAPSCRLLDRPDGGAPFRLPTGPVSAGTFLADVARAAAALPPGPTVLNLCRSRYAFAVGLAATVASGRTALLNLSPAGIGARFPATVLVTDEPEPGAGLPTLVLDPRPGPARTDANPLIPTEHPAALVFTSGSTGVPVGHPKSWGELVARTRAAAERFDLAGGTVVGMVPPQHMYGLETTVLLPWHAPVTSWCGHAFFPADVLAALGASPAPRFLVTTPLQLRTLLGAGLDLPPTTCISATAPLDPDLAAAAEERWDGAVLEIFGATECGSIASRQPTRGPDWLPYPGVSLRIGEDGTVVSAPGAAPVPLMDLLEPGAGGTFRLLGRRTDVVKLGGRRASLSGLNRALTAVPGVDDGVFLVPEDLDRHPAARLLAVVVAPRRTGAAILSDLRRVIDPVFLPRRVIQVDAMPRNSMGKLPRQALLDLVSRTGAGAGADAP